MANPSVILEDLAVKYAVKNRPSNSPRYQFDEISLSLFVGEAFQRMLKEWLLLQDSEKAKTQGTD